MLNWPSPAQRVVERRGGCRHTRGGVGVPAAGAEGHRGAGRPLASRIGASGAFTVWGWPAGRSSRCLTSDKPSALCLGVPFCAGPPQVAPGPVALALHGTHHSEAMWPLSRGDVAWGAVTLLQSPACPWSPAQACELPRASCLLAPDHCGLFRSPEPLRTLNPAALCLPSLTRLTPSWCPAPSPTEGPSLGARGGPVSRCRAECPLGATC